MKEIRCQYEKLILFFEKKKGKSSKWIIKNEHSMAKKQTHAQHTGITKYRAHCESYELYKFVSINFNVPFVELFIVLNYYITCRGNLRGREQQQTGRRSFSKQQTIWIHKIQSRSLTEFLTTKVHQFFHLFFSVVWMWKYGDYVNYAIYLICVFHCIW